MAEQPNNPSSTQPHPTYLSTLKICRVELCTELFMLSSYLVSMLFADLLSLHLITILMLFTLVHVTVNCIMKS